LRFQNNEIGQNFEKNGPSFCLTGYGAQSFLKNFLAVFTAHTTAYLGQNTVKIKKQPFTEKEVNATTYKE